MGNINPASSLKRWLHYLSAALAVAVLTLADQYTKMLAVEHLKGQPSVVLLPDVFELFYLENRGAAFGMLQDQQVFFLAMVSVVCVFVLYFYFHVPMTGKYLPVRICAVFLVAGAVGNGIDRVRQGYVVDFFYFKWIDFPVFNVADIYVTCTVFALLLLVFFYYKEEDFEQLFPCRRSGRAD